MKKIFVIFLLSISYYFMSNVRKVSLENIDLSLSHNELGIIFINLSGNNGLFLSLNNKNILYIFKLENYNMILNYLKPLNMNIDYVIMNNAYSVIGNKIIFNDSLYLNNIVFNRNDYIMINYNDKTLCVNPTYNNCDFVYYTIDTDFLINDNNKVFMYNDNINNDKVYDKWVDSYKITKNNYTIMKIKDDYEIVEILKNI